MNSSLLKDIQETAAQLRLPTIAREGGQAFLKAGQLGALDTFFEVLMMEIEERKERRVERIEAPETFSNLDTDRLPRRPEFCRLIRPKNAIKNRRP